MFRSAFSAANSPANCWGVAPVYVQREDAAIFATDCSGTSLELGSVVLPDCTMASYEILDGGNKRIATVGIEISRLRCDEGFGNIWPASVSQARCEGRCSL